MQVTFDLPNPVAVPMIRERPAPRVRLGMPVYNGGDYVAEALDSILAQTYDEFELVVSDNGSTDRTEEICRY